MSEEKALTRLAILIAAVVAPCFCQSAMAGGTVMPSNEKMIYPASEKSDDVDRYGGHPVPDPYHWLENPNSSKTKTWIAEENALTRSFLDRIPAREAIHQRLTELYNYERYSVPLRCGDFLFFWTNSGLQKQYVLVVQDKSHQTRVLLDPNLLSSDGTTSVTNWAVTNDGCLLAYGLSNGGSGGQDWYVKDVASGKDLPDHLKWIRNTSIAWTNDGRGFYYCQYRKPSRSNLLLAPPLHARTRRKVFFHAVGTQQSADKLIYERKHQKKLSFSPTITDDGHYLVISVYQGTSQKSGLAIQDLQDPHSRLREVVPVGQAMYRFIGSQHDTFFFITDQGAPKGKIISLQLKDGVFTVPKEIVSESANTLDEVSLLSNKLLICNYMKDASSLVEVHDLSGAFVRQIQLPGIGSASGFYGAQSDKTTYFRYTSYTNPGSIFSINLDDFTEETFFQPKCAFKADDFTTEQIFYASKDGTRIPMSISYKKGLTKDGHNPTYLYGYGGFKVCMLPDFSVSALTWMDRGGIYAVPSLRGGGEYGESWHLAGMQRNKQNVFDDFIAAAQTLIDQKYTSVERLAIGGSSNGGLLIGACMTQRPDLFAAALPTAGVMDVLRYTRYGTFEYGSSESANDFPVLFRYSPLQNLKKDVCYPATLVCTADNDDVVTPWHSYKFAAALQDAQSCNKPTLIRIDTKVGHGRGEATNKIIDRTADEWAFLERVMNVLSSPQ